MPLEIMKGYRRECYGVRVGTTGPWAFVRLLRKYLYVLKILVPLILIVNAVSAAGSASSNPSNNYAGGSQRGKI